MHTIEPYEPEYCRQCGDPLHPEGFCMKCDGMAVIEETEAEVLPQIPVEQPLDFEKEEKEEYERDTIANGVRQADDTDTDVEPGDLERLMSEMPGWQD